ncbi:MAG: LD-carboxypeptidase [Deltaproteobacteria bacterium]|nr:MAG: LD-carboxypeptidase [Deltaproteobacteria bacterium]
MKLFKPAPLRKGEKIGIVAPAGSVDEGQLNTGVNAVLEAGFQVELAPGILGRIGYLAGEKEQRAKALEDFFHRPDIRAIFCARGGFGSVQLLPFLDAEAIRRRPKIFVGYSDVSILLNWLLQQCSMVTFHSPMVANELAQGLEGRNKDFFWGTLLGEKRQWQIQLGAIIRPGVVQAPMIGGCLSTIVTTLATPFEIETADKILFLEDIGEKPYRIERMLTHLQMAGKFKGIAGLVFGSFTDCEGQEERGLVEIIRELFRDAPYPVVEGLAAGHGKENILLPFGVQMALDGTAGVLSLLESPLA